MVTLTAMQLVYFSSTGGFMLGVIALWLFVEIWKQVAHAIAKPTGSHRMGARRDGRADRTVLDVMTSTGVVLSRVLSGYH